MSFLVEQIVPLVNFLKGFYHPKFCINWLRASIWRF